MKKKFLLILLFLTNCSYFTDSIFKPNFPDPNNFVNRFGGNQRGVIIFKLNSKHPTTTWCKSDLKKDVDELNCFDLKTSNYYQILMIEPGNYEIRAYENYGKKYGKNYINPKVSNLTQRRISRPLISFKVKEDRISFLGQINFKNIKNLEKQSNDKDFEEIKESFLKQDKSRLERIFKGHKVEAKTLAEKLNKSEENILIKDLAKSQFDLSQEEKENRKKSKKSEKNNKNKKSKYDFNF